MELATASSSSPTTTFGDCSRSNSLDVAEAADRRRVESLRARAVKYVRETLKLRIDDELADDLDVLQLPLIASGHGRLQRHACILLKVMHIIYHLDARELRTRLAISDNEVFSLVETSVVQMFDDLRQSGVPVVEFSWSRKTLSSLITKMMVKRQTSAARVFDRLRFRLVVDSPENLVPTLHVMLHRCIPFNYVVPAQTVNTLVEVTELDVLADAKGGALRGPSGRWSPRKRVFRGEIQGPQLHRGSTRPRGRPPLGPRRHQRRTRARRLRAR